MTGTDKQIAWAQSIISESRSLIANNIKNCVDQYAAHPEADFYLLWMRIWKRIDHEFETAMGNQKCQSATFIIDKRHYFDADAIRQQEEKLRFMLDNHPEKIDEYLIY